MTNPAPPLVDENTKIKVFMLAEHKYVNKWATTAPDCGAVFWAPERPE